MILFHGSLQIVREPRILVPTRTKTYTLIDQMLFHTEKALQTLTFSQVKEVRV